eukprot:gene8138-16728_t
MKRITHSLLLSRTVTTTRKMIKPRDKRPIIENQRNRNAELEEKATKMGLNWRLVTASILHRYPVITPDSQQWEKDMWDIQDIIEEKKRKWFMDQVEGSNADILHDSYPSPEEILESMPFKPAPRITEADETNNRRSLERKLPRSLFLVVKRNREDFPWQFPQGKWNIEETMRGTAERVLDRAVGKIRRYFISNSPVGHFCYEYPPALQQQRQQFGAKVFFYRAQLIAGDICLETRLDEIGEYVDPETAEFMSAALPE